MQDRDRDSLLKIRSDLKFQSDLSQQTVNDLVTKVALLEQNMRNDEMLRNELRQKLRITEEQNMDMQNFIKSLHNQSEAELAQMRQLLQSKTSEDHVEKIKVKEKNSILFNELVRIGQQSEKHGQVLNGLNQQLEQRIAYLEQRLSQQEQSNQMVNRKGDAASMFLNEVFERVESKVMGLEQQVQLVNSEQRRDKENIGRLEVTNLKHNDEFRNILTGIQNDMQFKLEIKMTDLVNRLLSEQD